MIIGMQFWGGQTFFQALCASMLSFFGAQTPDRTGQVILANSPRFGHGTQKPSYFGRQFIKHALRVKGQVIDIGAGAGVTSIPIARHERPVTAIDIEKGNLKMISRQIPRRSRKYIQLKEAEFPFLNIEKDSLEAAAVLNVFHFFDDEKMVSALERLYSWMRPGNDFKLVIECQTPFLRSLMDSDFFVIYQNSILSGKPMPGYIDNLGIYLKDRAGTKPLCLRTAKQLLQILEAAGFQIDKIGYVARPDYPLDLIDPSLPRNPNRISHFPLETVGAVVHKPEFPEMRKSFKGPELLLWELHEKRHFRNVNEQRMRRTFKMDVPDGGNWKVHSREGSK